MFNFFNKRTVKNLDISKYNIPESLRIDIRLTREGKFVVTSPDMPGFITQASSNKELIPMLNDAILTYYDVPHVQSDEVIDNLVDCCRYI